MRQSNVVIDELAVSTPGRVCLFGEHQDYLRLPVIPCAISLRISVSGKQRSDSHVHLDLSDIQAQETFSLHNTIPYIKERDYFRSAVNVLMRHGFTFSRGVDCRVQSTIPINAGTSSSSALIVGWINFLTQMSDQCKQISPMELGTFAYEAEVLEFGEPGGMMDQYSTAFGGVLAIDFYPSLKIEPLETNLKTFVLGDSGEPKDTKNILAKVKNQVQDIVKILSEKYENFSLFTLSAEQLEQFKPEIPGKQYELLAGTIRNRDITLEARKLFHTDSLDHRYVGTLLTEHQNVLRDILNISSPKIDGMLDAAMNAGAYGGKINGSGGGGCMFAYAPEHPEQVADAIERAGGKAYIVTMDEGSRNDVKGGNR
jgi:galactokinase